MFKTPLKQLFRKLFDFEERNSKDIRLGLQRLALSSSAAYVYQHMLHVASCDTREELYDRALQAVPKMEGMYLEFGVFKGASINYWAPKVNATVFGFDSFDGLPEFWRDGYGKGAFKVAGLPPVPSNVQLIKGWFNDTLPGFLKEQSGPIAFLHIDCDLYSATKTIFEQCGTRLKVGSVLVFDEYFNYPGWENGEFKAFHEFIDGSNMGYEYISYNAQHEQVVVRLTEKQ